MTISRWKKAVYEVCLTQLLERIQTPSAGSSKSNSKDGATNEDGQPPSRTRFHLRWRVGWYLYKLERFEECIESLTQLCDDVYAIEDAKERKKLTQLTADHYHLIHLTIARCGLQMYLATNDYDMLVTSHEEYEDAMINLTVDLSAMLRLPPVMMEHARVLEFYGSFDSALEVYGKVLTNFPTFKGYFDALYRTAIVGLHMAAVKKTVAGTDGASKAVEIEEAVDKCIDIFQFLLEALPTNIDEVHIVLLYLRAFEISASPQQRFRAVGIMASLFEVCKRKQVGVPKHATLSREEKSTGSSKNILDTLDRNARAKEELRAWQSDLGTWLEIGRYCISGHEPLLARIAFAKFEEEARKKVPPGKDMSLVVSYDTAYFLARHFQAQRDYVTAFRYAEIGLHHDRYNRHLRELLVELQAHVPVTGARWSDQIQREIASATRIIRCWKNRAWTPGFRRRLKEQVVREMEQRLAANRFDVVARSVLAYYARDTYRHRFLFEEACARRIQRVYRDYRKHYVWLEAQRRHIATLASDALHRFHRRPFSPRARAEVLRLATHRLMSRRHPIQTALRSIQQQQESLLRLVRFVKALLLQRAIKRRIHEKHRLLELERHRQSRRIQSWVRVFLARRRILRLRLELQLRSAAARKIQDFYRRYRKLRKRHFLHRRLRRMHQRDRQAMMRKQVQRARHRQQQQAAGAGNGADEDDEDDEDEDDPALFMSSSASAATILHALKHRAMLTLRRLLTPHVRALLQRRRRGEEVHKQRTRRFMERTRLLADGQRQVMAAVRIQRFYRSRVAGFWFAVTRKLVRQRRRRRRAQHFYARKTQDRHILSHMSRAARHALLADRHDEVAAQSTDTQVLQQWVFVPPGLDPLHPDFRRLCAQDVAVLLGARDCTASNLQMLGLALCQPQCRLRCLFFVDCDVFAQQPDAPLEVFFKGLRRCASLRALLLLGGRWPAAALRSLFHLVQVENPRIESLCVEQVALGGGTAETLVLRSARLLGDFLNYSLRASGLGGLRELSLHGCGLWDSHVAELCRGLEVSAALQSLTLSLNLLSDDALLLLLRAMQANKHQPLRRLDLQDNLVRLSSRDLRDALHAFRNVHAAPPRALVSPAGRVAPAASAYLRPLQLAGAAPRPKKLPPTFSLPATHFRDACVVDLRRNFIAEPFDCVASAAAQHLPCPQLSLLQDAPVATDAAPPPPPASKTASKTPQLSSVLLQALHHASSQAASSPPVGTAGDDGHRGAAAARKTRRPIARAASFVSVGSVDSA